MIFPAFGKTSIAKTVGPGTLAWMCMSRVGEVVVGSFHASFLIPMLSHCHAHSSALRVMHSGFPGHHGSREDDNRGHTLSPFPRARQQAECCVLLLTFIFTIPGALCILFTDEEPRPQFA